jgi:prepilin peptidase CpaA
MLDGTTFSVFAAAGLAGLAGAAFLWAAASDLGAYRIPNLSVVLLIALFPAYSFLAGGAAPLLPHAAVGGAVLAIGIPLYAFGLAGAGDFKLLAAASLWAGPDRLPLLLMVMALCGGLLATAYWLRGRCRMKSVGPALDAETETAMSEEGTHLPYGVAISAAGLVVLAQQLQVLFA